LYQKIFNANLLLIVISLTVCDCVNNMLIFLGTAFHLGDLKVLWKLHYPY